MRRLVLAMALVFSGCGDDDGPTKPADPNAQLYGFYVGLYGHYSDDRQSNAIVGRQLAVELTPGTVALWLDGELCPAALVSLEDPSVAISATLDGKQAELRGFRAGARLSGTAGDSAWSVSR